MTPLPDMQVTDGTEVPKRAVIGPILSIAATVMYGITYFTLVINPEMSIPVNFFTLILFIAFAPMIMFFMVIGIIVVIMLIVGAVMNAFGKTKAGGIITIVFSCVGIFFAAFSYFIPLGLGIAGGILCILKK